MDFADSPWFGVQMRTPEHAGLYTEAARLARKQHGVLSRLQLTRIGFTRGAIWHRVQSGRFESVSANVFRLEGSADTWLQRLMIACLAWGDGAVVADMGAAAIWKLQDGSTPVTLIVQPGRRREGAPGTVRRTVLPVHDVVAKYGIPVTNPARTLIDLAAFQPEPFVEECLDVALRRGLTSIGHLKWRFEQQRTAGVSVMRRLVMERERGAVPMSKFETRLLRLIKEAGLPPPTRQHPIHTPEGTLIGVADFAYPAFKLIIEADSFEWHSGRKEFVRDRIRGNTLVAMGYRILRVTWTQLINDPDGVIAAIRAGFAAASTGN